MVSATRTDFSSSRTLSRLSFVREEMILTAISWISLTFSLETDAPAEERTFMKFCAAISTAGAAL